MYFHLVMQDGLILVPGNRRLFTVIEEDDFQYPHTKVRHRFYIYYRRRRLSVSSYKGMSSFLYLL
jgi:hypothetical protein